jgi:hypothetical protein
MIIMIIIIIITTTIYPSRTVIIAAPAPARAREISTALISSSAVPVRILTVTGISTYRVEGSRKR